MGEECFKIRTVVTGPIPVGEIPIEPATAPDKKDMPAANDDSDGMSSKTIDAVDLMTASIIMILCIVALVILSTYKRKKL